MKKIFANRFASALAIIAGIWFWAAFAGMYLEKHLPFLHPFVIWTFRVYLGVFAAAAIGLTVVAPGVYMGRELYDIVSDSNASKVETRLAQIWAGIGGAFLSLLLGAAAALICFGTLRFVRLWFIGVCWTALFVPWCVLGYFGRKLIRHFWPPTDATANTRDKKAAS